MTGKMLIALTMLVMALSCATSSRQQGKANEQPKGQPPKIVDYYAVDAIRPGETWKFYLHAEDKDGDMEYIAALMYEPGVGYYPTSTTWLSKEEGRKLEGYVFLHIPSERNLIGDKVQLTIMIRDRQQNGSQAVRLTLLFKDVPQTPLPEKWQAAAGNKLGSLSFNLGESTQEIDRE
ncbi:MAG: hypothetical protein JRJ12_17860 [Deltaproteobacteria bacterium]|nr:hypothetical protein [Deltaproteobacteria bacterium]MBW2073046.1 hypothetical protein [Deltaproteobacteria bacterium]